MGPTCSTNSILFNANCLSVADLLVGVGFLIAVILILISIAINFTYVKEQFDQGKRLIFRSPVGFGEKRIKTTKSTVKKTGALSTLLFTWVLIMLIVVAIVVPTAALIASK